MKIFLDTANVEEIKEINDWGILDGVTTNPSLIASEGRDFVQVVYEITQIVKGPTSAEVVAQDTEGMVREGRLLAQISEHIVVKIPLIPAGLAAIKQLNSEGINTNVTLCFQATQALLAAKAGASYISPFIGRLDDISWEGVPLLEQIREIYDIGGFQTQILAASIRHPLHLVQAALAGADVATLPYKVMVKSMGHPLTDIGNARFLADWATVGDTDITARVTRWLAENR